MSQNLVIPNKDNKVVFVFGGINLNLSTNIGLDLDGEAYSTTGANPKLAIESDTELSCDLSDTAKLGKIFATVTYFDGASVNGTDITSRELGNSDQIIIAIGTQLIIEDGSIVAGANSFASDEEFKTYANLRCVAVPSAQPERESLLILAMDYLFSVESKLQGCRVSVDQELVYPRSGVSANGFNIPSDSIPKSLKNAQMELAIQASTSGLFIDGQNQNVQREKLGDLEVEYFSGGSWATVRTDSTDAYLKPLMINGGNSNIMGRV